MQSKQAKLVKWICLFCLSMAIFLLPISSFSSSLFKSSKPAKQDTQPTAFDIKME